MEIRGMLQPHGMATTIRVGTQVNGAWKWSQDGKWMWQCQSISPNELITLSVVQNVYG